MAFYTSEEIEAVLKPYSPMRMELVPFDNVEQRKYTGIHG